MRLVALLGISGVGKSTLVGQIRETTPLLHLQASELIRAEQLYRTLTADSSETLRQGPVLDNQTLMVAAFRREAAQAQLPVIFDGHSVIDGRDGLVEIPSAVFLDLGVDVICFLSADPALIADRRSLDLRKARPNRDVGTLRDHQEIALATARKISREIDRPFVEIMDGQVDLLQELLM